MMGLFSRKEKAPKLATNDKKLNPSQSNASLNSGASSLKSPAFFQTRSMNRTSGGANSTSGPGTPLTPFSPVHIPKIDLPKPPDPALDPAGYLRCLGAVRERCSIVTERAFRNDLAHFDVDMSKFDDVVTFVSQIIKVCLAAKIPKAPGSTPKNSLLT